MNTIITFALVALALIVSLVLSINSDVPRWYLAVGLGVVALAVPPFIDPFTRTLWTAIDLAMRPLEPSEVDWTVVDPAFVGSVSAGSSSGAVDGNSPDL